MLVFTRTGAIKGSLNWTGGTVGEAQTNDARGIVAGQGDWLLGEKQNGTWYEERELIVPVDLAPQTVVAVSALDHFSVDESASTVGDAEASATRDERLLVGTGENGLLFVYQRSALSESLGAIAVSHDTIPRIFPFPRRAEG